MAVLLASGTARGEDGDDAKASDAAPERSPPLKRTIDRPLSFDAGFGAGQLRTRDARVGMSYFGATFLSRHGLFTYGTAGQVGGAPFTAYHEYIGGLGGLSLDPSRWVRFDVLGELGGHLAQPDAGLALSGETTRIVAGDTLVAVPYAGLRLGPSLVLGDALGVRVLVGAWLAARSDLLGTTARYTVETCGGASCTESPRSLRVGGGLVDAGLRIGAEFGP